MKVNEVKGREEATRIRDKVSVGIVVFSKDVVKAKELLAEIESDGELHVFDGGSIYTTFSVIADESKRGLVLFKAALNKANIRNKLILAVPVEEFQTEPRLEGDVVRRTFCTAKGLPVRTKRDSEPDSGYDLKFDHSNFWVIVLEIDVATGAEKFVATFFGQYDYQEGENKHTGRPQPHYREVCSRETREPITHTFTSFEDIDQSRYVPVNPQFLYAMVSATKKAADLEQEAAMSLSGPVVRRSRPRRKPVADHLGVAVLDGNPTLTKMKEVLENTATEDGVENTVTEAGVEETEEATV